MQSNLSARHQNILLNLLRALSVYKVSLQDLVKKIFSFPKQFLTDKEFQKVIKFGDLKLTFDEIDSLFSILEERERVSVALLNKLLKRISSQEDNTNNINSGNDLKLIGIKQVKNYLKQKGPYEVFDMFDNDKDDMLDIKQLNELFIACSPTFKQNKEARINTIRLLLEKLPYNMIDVGRFLKTFGLQNQPKRVILDEPLDMMKSRLDVNLKNLYMNKQQIKPNQSIEPVKPPNDFNDSPPLRKRQIKPYKAPNKQQTPNNFFQPVPPPSKPNHNYSHLTNSLPYYRLEEKYIEILELVQFYLSNRQNFVDSQNPKSGKGKFVKASQIFKGKFSLIQVAQSVIEREKNRKGLGLQFEAKDIIQGSVGNCYLLSSLSSVVDKYPQFVSNYFLFNVNPSGIYVVRLFNDGEWSNIVLDDRFPCNGTRPLYAKPHGNQIWVMLLEKAWAKLHGSYQNIDLGSSLQAFIALTGAPCKYMRQQEDKQNDAKSFILDGFRKKGMVTCSGSPKLNKMPKQQAQKYGLIGSHAYSVLNVFSLTDPQTKQSIQIIRIRNPWGNLEWRGDWSFESKKWTPQLRQKYNYVKNPNDGSFYMDYNDFAVYFSSITVCYMEPNYVNSSLRINVDRHLPYYVSVQINKPGLYVFTIYQESKRKYQHKGTYQLSQSSLIITSSGNQYKYIQSGTKGQSNLSVQHNFEPGIYIIKLNVKWNYFNSHQCVLTSYGPETVQLKQIKKSDVEPRWNADMINSFANKFPGEVTKYTKIGIPEATRQVFFSIEYGLGYIKIKNPSKKQFTTSINLKQQKGLKLLDIFEMPMKAQMSPNAEQLYGFCVSGKGYSYSLEQHLQYKG